MKKNKWGVLAEIIRREIGDVGLCVVLLDIVDYVALLEKRVNALDTRSLARVPLRSLEKEEKGFEL